MKQKLLNNFRLRVWMLVAMMCAAFTGTTWGQDETITFSDKYSTNTIVDETPISGTDFSIVFNRRNGGTATQYYTNGNAVRWYGGGTLVVSSSTKTITKINITFTQTANSISTDVGTYSNGTWTGSASSVTFSQSGTSGHCRISAIAVTYATGGGSSAEATTTTIDASGITNTDVYTSTAAGSLAATVTAGGNAVAGASVTWSGNNDAVATIDAETGEVTLVSAGNVFFTATYAGVTDTYQSSTDTYEMTVTSSAPYVQPTEFEIALNNTLFGTSYSGSVSGITDGSPISGTQDNVTVTYAGSGNHYVNDSQIRFYPNNKLTFEAPFGYVIKEIAFTSAGTWAATISANTGSYDTSTKTWTGEAKSVLFTGSGSSRCDMSKATVTLEPESTDPSISANDVNIAYDATGGTINYTINNPVEDGSVSVDFDSEGDWLTATVNNGTVSFTCTANETNAERQAIVLITYTYNTDVTVEKEVLITQDAAPVIYTTIPALFADATNTATDVNVTFGGWVVSAVNGSNAYLTDNQGHGLIIYASNHGFQVNDVLTGTVSCKLQLYRGSAELTNLIASTEGLTVTQNGSVTAQTIAISELGGVNTGALLSFEGLTYNGKALVDDSSNAITPYSTLYSGTFENGKSYDVTGIYLQYNTTKELLPRSADDIEEVQVQHQDYALTVSLGDNVSAIFVFDVDDDTDPLIADGAAGTVQVADGTQVLVSPDVASGFVLESLMVDGVDVTSQMDNSGAYTFTMPTHAVTISATAEEYVAPVGTNYTLASSITSGKHYIIVNQEASKAMGAQNSNNRTVGDIYIANQTATVASDAGVAEFVIYGPDAKGFYTIYDAAYNENAGGYLYAANSSSNYLRTRATNDDDNGRWAISIDNDGVASIVAQGSYSRNVMQYNSGSSLFSCYGLTSQKPVYLFEKDGEATPTESVTVTDAGYATFASDNALDFTSTGIEAYIAKADGTTGVTFTQVNKVPAGTGVLLYKEGGTTVDVPALTGAADDITDNVFKRGVGVQVESVDVSNEHYFHNYILNNVEGVLGFYKANNQMVATNRAYIQIQNDESISVKSFIALPGTVVGVNEVKSVVDDAVIFNLAGQRLSKAQRGINIINGKKVVVK